jgi:hypothetical protein
MPSAALFARGRAHLQELAKILTTARFFGIMEGRLSRRFLLDGSFVAIGKGGLAEWEGQGIGGWRLRAEGFNKNIRIRDHTLSTLHVSITYIWSRIHRLAIVSFFFSLVVVFGGRAHGTLPPRGGEAYPQPTAAIIDDKTPRKLFHGNNFVARSIVLECFFPLFAYFTTIWRRAYLSSGPITHSVRDRGARKLVPAG